MLYFDQDSSWLTIVDNVTVAQFLNHCSAQSLPGVTEAGGGIDSGAKKPQISGWHWEIKVKYEKFPFASRNRLQTPIDTGNTVPGTVGKREQICANAHSSTSRTKF